MNFLKFKCTYHLSEIEKKRENKTEKKKNGRDKKMKNT